ncbi:MAG: D-alanyl-D-alanine carboxypeptidase [Rhizobiaceae bacterium]|nr:D-alanyl-D-alanine carboxypeptidase [Rhizobiaceae bacterium]
MTATLAVSIGIAGGGDALAAKKKSSGNPKYAAIVVDANTGKTLFASSADAPRFPASLTKMMTLYLIFEGIENGKISRKTKVPFSAHASAQPPTKLGVKAGGSVTVETIIYSLVTKSANDSAAAIAEYLGGSEDGFARLMTTKAKRLGMTNTVFKNASGLPNGAQHSTARDMAILGIALREHFPQYYDYFETRSFAYGKQRMANHNRLLGRVKGVDGIKTGYTRASGFNLVSSVAIDGRKIVAVVMGGQTGGSRDNHMADLIEQYLPKASRRGGGDLVAKTAPAEIQPGGEVIAATAATALPKKNAPVPAAKPLQRAVAAAPEIVEETVTTTVHAYAAAAPRPLAEIDPIATSSTDTPSGWAVQVGSSPSKPEAQDMLTKAAKIAPAAVKGGSPFTVVFEKDGTTYHRARFGGFSSKTAAWNACNALKKKKIDCYAVQQ